MAAPASLTRIKRSARKCESAVAGGPRCRAPPGPYMAAWMKTRTKRATVSTTPMAIR